MATVPSATTASNGITQESTPPTLPTSPEPITTPHTINIGTRKSALARVQTDIVVALLQERWPHHTYQVNAISTMGDKNQVTALHDFGAKSLWTYELEDMLLNGEVDMIVHSLKDIPTQLPPRCTIGAILGREDPRDALVLSPLFYPPHVPAGTLPPTLAALPAGSIIGTSSVRRSAQLKRLYPHLAFASVRGNIGTRLNKLDAEGSTYAALILAAAGLQRMGWGARISGYLESRNVEGVVAGASGQGHAHETGAHQAAASKQPGNGAPDQGEDEGRGATDVEARQGRLGDRKWGMLHAVGQGALGIEIREGDTRVEELLGPLTDQKTSLACLAERSLMRTLEGGCSVPIGVETEWKDHEGGELTMRAIVVSIDGDRAADAEVDKTIKTNEDADQFGRDVALLLVQRGAGKILENINLDRPIIEQDGGA